MHQLGTMRKSAQGILTKTEDMWFVGRSIRIPDSLIEIALKLPKFAIAIGYPLVI